jgi:hypothetical protein
VLYERDSTVPYVRVLPAAIKIPDDQTAPALVDPRFPYTRVIAYPDTATVAVEPIRAGQAPAPSDLKADVVEWEPGRMRITLTGSEPKVTFLLVSENWYPDWHATVDGKPVPVHRGDYALLSVPLPAGAREVRLEFASGAYGRGKLITLVALLLTAGLLSGAALRSRLGRTRA